MAKSKQSNTTDLNALSNEALTDKINEETFSLQKMKFSHSVNPIENPMAIRGIRRSIARLKTEQTKRKNTK